MKKELADEFNFSRSNKKIVKKEEFIRDNLNDNILDYDYWTGKR
jgi:hypothetical protein